MLRAIREIQPRWVVGENVLGLVNWSGGLVFHEVQADLEAEGYEVQPFVLAAVSVNAPHRRDRIWFVAKNTRSYGRLCGESNQKGAEVREQRDIGAGDTERVCRAEMAGITADSECNGRRAGTKRKHNNIREWTICSDKSKDGDKVRSEFRDGGCNWVTAHANGVRLEQRKNSGEMGVRQTKICGAGGEFADATQTNGAFSDAPDTNSNGRQKHSGSMECESRTEKGGGHKFTIGSNDNGTDGDASDTNGIGLRGESDGVGNARFFGQNDKASNWENFPTVSPICDGNDGISDRLDGITFSKWRQESIKAGGNAVVPQVVLQIFRTIEDYEKLNTQ